MLSLVLASIQNIPQYLGSDVSWMQDSVWSAPIPFTVLLHIFEADLSLARPTQTKENKSSLMAVVRSLFGCKSCSETLEIGITSCEDWAQEMGDFEVFVV